MESMKNRGGFRPGIRKRKIFEKTNKEFVEEIRQFSDIIFKKLAYENYALIIGKDNVIEMLTKVVDIENAYLNVDLIGSKPFPIRFVKKNYKLERFMNDIHDERVKISDVYALSVTYNNLDGLTNIEDVYIYEDDDNHDIDRISMIKSLIEVVIPSTEKLEKWNKEVETEMDVEDKKEMIIGASFINLMRIGLEKSNVEIRNKKNMMSQQ